MMRDALFEPLTLPCGQTLKNRIAKSAMSDSLGDGTGHPTGDQLRLYQYWAQGGVGLSIIGEVQGNPGAAEKPGNLVLHAGADRARFAALAKAGTVGGARLWLQLGHAGAMTHPPIGTPKGPSALNLPGLTCAALTLDEIAQLPGQFAQTAHMAAALGFGGVQIHAAHGFLLSQFLSPLFNHRTDQYGGTIENRMRLLLETVGAVRTATGPQFAIAIKLNATDQLEGGLSSDDALAVVSALAETGIDLLDISGGTYFPGAPSASDGAGRGPYFLDFAKKARGRTQTPLMLTGGFKSVDQMLAARDSGIDVIGLARALILDPALPQRLQAGGEFPAFPRFDAPPEGGVTAWYTMRITSMAQGTEGDSPDAMQDVIARYEARDHARAETWVQTFGR